MDMGTSTTMADMAMSTTSAAMASATSMSSMDMNMDIGTYVMELGHNRRLSVASPPQFLPQYKLTHVQTGFISTSWHITSAGMFAGSCIGVLLLVIFLEFLRRSAKEYDRYIIRQFQRAQTITIAPNKPDDSEDCCAPKNTPPIVTSKFRPNVAQQMVRATFHMAQFTVAYFIMLLAMYYNGYFIICIIIGAWIGAFAFSWETIDMGGPQEEATVCCG
ncbi:Copper transport protein ctr4 [Lachnellula suecica]|uniref:Copper transport protein n=1 Tax=Lachnellula suecica TaxID=602035 RepID=A0A8T9BQE8_9HELO|nr:Copper transport protein ctr4 [Lachnellula suecica]